MVNNLEIRKEELNKNNGFTLIELLVVISIIGIILGLSIFSMQNSKKAGRDAKRKSDLELIRSGLELYKSDIGLYPDSLGSTLEEGGVVYITEVPEDPIASERNYSFSSDGNTYTICAALEQEVEVLPEGCGSCGETCSYKVTNP